MKSSKSGLEEALAFLTGDRWELSFIRRRNDVVKVGPRKLDLSTPDKIIMPYSDGLDSRAVAAIVGILLNAILPGKDYEFGVDEKGDTAVNFKV